MNVVSVTNQTVKLTPSDLIDVFTITDESTNATSQVLDFTLTNGEYYNTYQFNIELLPNRNYILKGYNHETLVVYDKLLCIDEEQQPTFTQRETTNDFIIYEQ